MTINTVRLQGSLLAAAGARPLAGLSSLSYYRHPIQENTVSDPPQFTAALISDHRARLLVVSADLCTIDRKLDARVREILNKRTGLPPEAVWLSATHTHSSLNQEGFRAEEFADRLIELLSQLEQELTPVHALSVRQNDLPGGYLINRRFHFPRHEFGAHCVMFNDDCTVEEDTLEVTRQIHKVLSDVGATPEQGGLGQRNILDGPTDRRLHLITLEGAHGPVAAFCRFNAHAVIVSQSRVGRQLSGDFPAYLRARLEDRLTCPVLPLNGAFGDVRPLHHAYNLQEARRFGEALADCVWSGAVQQHPIGEVSMSAHRERVPLRREVPPDVATGNARVSQLDQAIAAAATPAERKHLCDERARVAFATRILACENDLYLPSDSTTGTFDFDFRLLDLGSIHLLGIAGEPWYETAAEFERNTGALVIGCCGGQTGYLPTPEGFSEGGYETTYGLCDANGIRQLFAATRNMIAIRK